MTSAPSMPRYPRAVVLNVLGLLLMLLCGFGGLALAYTVNPKLCAALALAAVGYGGYLLATHNGDQG